MLVSANGEWAAVRELLQPNSVQNCPAGEFFHHELAGWPCLFVHSGWGKVATSSASQYIIDHYTPELIINIGTCGGFEGFCEVGETLLVTETVIYDIVERMADPFAATNFYRSSNAYTWIKNPPPSGTHRGRIASADQDIDFNAFDFLTQTHQALAADWETASFAWVASRNEIPWLALRMVSDIVSRHASETDGGVELWRSRLQTLMGNLLADLPFYLTEFSSNA